MCPVRNRKEAFGHKELQIYLVATSLLGSTFKLGGALLHICHGTQNRDEETPFGGHPFRVALHVNLQGSNEPQLFLHFPKKTRTRDG